MIGDGLKEIRRCTVQQSHKSKVKRSFYAIIFIGILLIFAHYPRRVTSSPNYDMVLRIVDQSKASRPIANATVLVIGIGSFVTNLNGNVTVTIPAGVYDIIVTWKSVYNPEPVRIGYAVVTLDASKYITIHASVYDVELKVITPIGRRPIANATVYISGVPLNVTSDEGKVFAEQVPSMYMETNPPYPITVIWFGIDISPDPVMITSTKTYILMANKIANLTIQIVGTQGQGINAALIEVKNSGGMIIFNGISDEQGIVRVEVPWDFYNLTINYKKYYHSQENEVISPIGIISIKTDLIVIFGQAMTFADFIIMIIMIIILFIVITIPLIYIHILRRKEKKREEEEEKKREEEEEKREEKYCQACGVKLPPNIKYCIECGIRQQDRLDDIKVKYCPWCRQKLVLDANYCIKCGTQQQSN